jgi:AsmA protein
MPEGLRRLGLAIAALLGVAVLLVGGGMSWLLNRDEVRAAVEAQIRNVTGFDLVVSGDASVSIFPVSAVSFRHVGLRDASADGPALVVDELTANLRLVPLLLKRFEIADLALTHPHIVVMPGTSGGSNWTPLIQRLAQTMKPGASDAVSFSEIRIKDGDLIWRDDTNRVQEKISDIDLSLAWPAISRSFAATGQLSWRGERLDGSVNIADFADALAGKRSGLRVRLGGSAAKVAFDGAMSSSPTLLMEGTLSADAPSLRGAFRWAGQQVPDGGGFGRFALKARTNVSASTIALTNVNIELDSNVAEGVLSYSSDGGRMLQATLAADALDLTPYASMVKLLASGARDWNRQPFDLRNLSNVDLDMRLSAARMSIGSTRIGRAALGASLRGGALTLSIGEAQMYGGLARGSLGISRREGAADIKAQFQLTDVDLESSLVDLFGFRRVSGRGNVTMALEAVGTSPYELSQSLSGDVALTGHDGALTGFDVEQLLKRLERRPLSGAGDFRNGRTPFDRINATLRLDDGLATIKDMRLDGPSVRLALTGTASVPGREFDMKGVASLVTPGAAQAAFELPFVLQGPWDDPLLFPDADSLIRRSPASAPLVDAVKNRSARDAVKSAIERLTGAKPVATPPAADAPATPRQD